MRISNKLALLLAGSTVTAALIALARTRDGLTDELRKVADQIRRIGGGMSENGQGRPPDGKPEDRTEPDRAPDRPADRRPSREALLTRALEEGTTLDELEKAYILRALERVEDNRTQAAQILGIGRRTLYRKLQDYGISEEDA